jgi:hypothetical protein
MGSERREPSSGAGRLGVFGIAERMADGSVDTLNRDDFYDLPKYW